VPAALALATLLAALGLWLRSDPTGALVRTSYDLSHALAQPWSPSLTNSAVVLVYLDAASYAAEGQDPARPWSRALHGQLLDRLTRAGARAVVFDILFDQPGQDPVADHSLAEAIRANGSVILAAELVPSSHAPGPAGAVRGHTFTPPTPGLAAAAASWGLANLMPDPDFVVRRHFAGFDPEREPALAWATTRFLARTASGPEAPSRWVRYYGPALTIPHVSYTHALDPAAVGDEAFRGRVVFVGARPMTAGVAERRDEFRNPLRSGGEDLFMPAVEVHATQMLNLLRGDGLLRVPAGVEAALGCGVALALGWGLLRLRPWLATGATVGAGGLLLAGVVAGFAQGVWGAWLVVAAVQLPVALGASVIFHSLDWYRVRRRLEAERRRAEARIREQAALLDKAQDAILVQDFTDRFVYANPGAARLYGWSVAEFGTEGVAARLFAPSADRVAAARQALTERGEWQGELEQATRPGGRVLVESRWTLIRDDAGRPGSVLMLNTDVTERRKLESQVVRTQRLQAVWSLASGMAHDLNNALAPVLMGIQRLRKCPVDEGARELLAAMETHTRRGAEMVRQVLAFSRGRGEAFELLNPGRLLQEMERVAAQTFPASIRVSTLAPPDLWPVFGNAAQLHQVLLNLGVNARDAMPAGGELTLAADNVPLEAAEAQEIPGALPGDYVMLLVADTGAGIPAEVWPRLFEPIFTTKAEGQGTGLGLSTSAQIVRGHGGFINVRSEAGVGTTFEVYLPRATAPASSGVAELPVVPQGREEALLVLHPESAVRSLLRSTLEAHGYLVIEAGDAAAGLAALAEPARTWRAVLLDHELPVRGAPATLAAIRQSHPRLPVILLGADRMHGSGAGADEMTRSLPRPFHVAELIELLRGLRPGSASSLTPG
jgi:PAS domain S-box-containing protein